MHEATKNELERLDRWRQETIDADAFAIALQEGIPEREDEGPHASIGASIGDLTLSLFEAESVDEIIPYLQHVRKCGFERRGDPVENGTTKSITWKYVAQADREQRLAVALYLKQGDNAGCSYVKVGTKEVDDYRLLCGEELKKWNEGMKRFDS